MKKQGKRKAPAEEPAKGMGIDTILENLADLKDIAASLQTPRDDPEPTRSRVAACEAATDILTALQDEGIKDPEQVRDLIHDYNALALQYQHLRHTYEEGDRPQRLGSSKVFVCPACRQQQRPGNNNCWNCGHRLIWGGGGSMEAMTTAEIIHVYENSTLRSKYFTREADTAAYVAGLAALHEKAERENPAPLTPEQIKQMRGKPVYCPEMNSYGVITFDTTGPWANVPFLLFYWLEREDDPCGVQCQYNIEERGLTIYPYKPKEKGGGST